jgi:hypothetical protein
VYFAWQILRSSAILFVRGRNSPVVLKWIKNVPEFLRLKKSPKLLTMKFLVEDFPQIQGRGFFQKILLKSRLWYNSLSCNYENLLTNKNL